MTPFDPALATKIATEMAEDDERASAGQWGAADCISPQVILYSTPAPHGKLDHSDYTYLGRTYADSKGQGRRNLTAIARLRNNARSAAEQLRAAVAEVESLARDNAILVAQRDAWQANADRIALERRSEEMAAIHDRDRLAAENQRLRSGTCSGVIPSTHIACGEGGNYCSEACRLSARVKELEAFVRDCSGNWDCDSDAHKYGTGCRSCNAQELLDNSRLGGK